jgi:hypothetical protein
MFQGKQVQQFHGTKADCSLVLDMFKYHDRCKCRPRYFMADVSLPIPGYLFGAICSMIHAHAGLPVPALSTEAAM